MSQRKSWTHEENVYMWENVVHSTDKDRYKKAAAKYELSADAIRSRCTRLINLKGPDGAANYSEEIQKKKDEENKAKDDFIIANYSTMRGEDIAKAIGMKLNSIYFRVARLKERGLLPAGVQNVAGTEAEMVTQFIRENGALMTNQEMAEQLGVKISVVNYRVLKLQAIGEVTERKTKRGGNNSRPAGTIKMIRNSKYEKQEDGTWKCIPKPPKPPKPSLALREKRKAKPVKPPKLPVVKEAGVGRKGPRFKLPDEAKPIQIKWNPEGYSLVKIDNRTWVYRKLHSL